MKKDKENINKEDKKVLTKEEKKEQNGSLKEKLSLKLRKRLIASRVRTLVLVACLVAIFIALNLWAQSKELQQIDVTENKLYSLTDTSKDQLNNLKKDVNIYVYGYEDGSQYVEFVKQYAAYSDKINYEVVTTENNYEIVEKYSLSDSGTGAIVVACGDKNTTLNPDYEFSSYDELTGGSVDKTEETITNAILNVTTDDPVKIYFTTGQGEISMNKLTILKQALEAKVYECEELNLLSVSEIPEDCDILAIIGPESDLNANEAKAVKSYISKGGNIFFTMTKKTQDKFPNLQSVLDLYGVSVDPGILYEGNYNNCATFEGSSYPTVLMPNFSSASDITSTLTDSGYSMLLPWAQKLTIKDVEEENVNVGNVELLYTSEKCYAIKDIKSNKIDTSKMEASAYTIAANFTRTMTTPAKEGEETKEKSVESKLIIVGNSTFLADNDENLQLLATPIAQGANGDFALNCFADLAEQDNLITVKKAANVTTFTSTSMEDIIVKTIIFGVPVIIILVGIIVWNIRRRKR